MWLIWLLFNKKTYHKVVSFVCYVVVELRIRWFGPLTIILGNFRQWFFVYSFKPLT